MKVKAYERISGRGGVVVRLILLVTCFALVSTACESGPTVDGTDAETFDASIAAIKAALPEEDQEQIDEVLEAFEYLYSDNVISSLNASEAIRNRIQSRLDGMDAGEIFAEWTGRVDKAIESLEAKKVNTDSAMENLKDVRVRGAEYYVQRGQSVAKINIHNRTDHIVSRVYFRGTLWQQQPRKWLLEDDFNYNIRRTEGKNLEPGDRAEWNFALLSPVWKRAPEDVDNLSLSVIVTRIDGGQEQPIFDAFTDRFTTKDSRRLRRLVSLKESIGTLEPEPDPEETSQSHGWTSTLN